MNTIRADESKTRSFLLVIGIFTLTIALYQNFVLDLPYFYALFSLGMFLILLALYHSIATETLFENWRFRDIVLFSLLLLLACVIIDRLGMRLGYWEYPHYDRTDEVRKYALEWAIALLYHMLSLLLGMQLFLRLKMGELSAFFLAMVVVVTPVGLITEALNLNVYSWRVLQMPFTDFQIGGYFLVFQTIGYWLMALIPYAIYLLIDLWVRKRYFTENQMEKAGA